MANLQYLNVLVENGVFEIYVGSDGKIHIRWILPDPPPEVFTELQAVSVVLNQAARLKDRGVAEKFQQFAEGILNNRAKELKGFLGQEQQVAGVKN
jgi:hypothetical protein